jgi:hypothetical protein
VSLSAARTACCACTEPMRNNAKTTARNTRPDQDCDLILGQTET